MLYQPKSLLDQFTSSTYSLYTCIYKLDVPVWQEVANYDVSHHTVKVTKPLSVVVCPVLFVLL